MPRGEGAQAVLRRCFTDTPSGSMHHAETGRGRPLVLLHQTPRSWREFEWTLPFLADEFRCLVVDMPGFGDSDAPTSWTIEALADGVIDFVDAMELDRFALLGHHTGGVVAYEVASRLGERVTELVLSCVAFSSGTPLGPAASGHTDLDNPTPEPDGAHFLRLWSDRAAYYPRENRTQLLQRTIADILRATDPVKGHLAVANYVMMGKETDISGRVLCLTGDQDPTYAARAELLAALPQAELVEFRDGGVALPEQSPREFGVAVRDFLNR